MRPPASLFQHFAGPCLLAATYPMAWACTPQPATGDPGFQGIVEFGDRSLAFEVPGKLIAVSVSEGDRVELGTELARLDDKLERLSKAALEAQSRATQAELDLLYAGARPEQLRSARARLRAARATQTYSAEQLDRTLLLNKQGVVTDAELDAAQNAMDQAEARQAEAEQVLAELSRGPRSQEIQAAEARLDAATTAVRAADERIRRHALYADGPAEVLEVTLHPGEFASIGTQVVILADTDHPTIDVFVPQDQIGDFGVRQQVAVRVDSLDIALGGVVEHVSRATEFTPRYLFSPKERPNLVVRVRVRVADPDHWLRAGIPAFVRLDAALPVGAYPTLPERNATLPSAESASPTAQSSSAGAPAPTAPEVP